MSKHSRHAAPTGASLSSLSSLSPFDDLAKPFVLLEGSGDNPSKAILVGSSHVIDVNSLDWLSALATYLSQDPAGHFLPTQPVRMFFELKDVKEYTGRVANTTLSLEERSYYMALDRGLDSTVSRFLSRTYGDSITLVELDQLRRSMSEEDPECERAASSFDSLDSDATLANLMGIAKAAYRGRARFGWLPAMRHYREIVKTYYPEVWKQQFSLREPGWKEVMEKNFAFTQNSVIVAGFLHFAEIFQWFVVEKKFKMEDPVLKLWKNLATQDEGLHMQQGELLVQQREVAQLAINQVMAERPIVLEDLSRRRLRQEQQEQLQIQQQQLDQALQERRRERRRELREGASSRTIELTDAREAPEAPVVKTRGCACFWKRLLK